MTPFAQKIQKILQKKITKKRFLTFLIFGSIVLIVPLSYLYYQKHYVSLVGQYNDVSIPTYTLLISEKNLKKLNDNLPAEDEYILQEKHKKYVPAEIIIDNKKYSIGVRYKGDWGNHWRYKKKSYMIKFKKDKYPLFHNKKISLNIPSDKGYFLEMFLMDLAKKMNLPSPRNEIAYISVNGESPLLYWVNENYDESFLANNNFTDETDFFDGDIRAYTPKNVKHNSDEKMASLTESPAYFDVKISSEKHKYTDYAPIYELLKLLHNKEISPNEMYNRISKVVDIKNLTKIYALNRYIFSEHFDNLHNWKFIFDSSQGKIVFFPWDITPWFPDVKRYNNSNFDSATERLLFYKIGKSDRFINGVREKTHMYIKKYKGTEAKTFENMMYSFTTHYLNELDKNKRQKYFGALTTLEDILFVLFKRSEEFSKEEGIPPIEHIREYRTLSFVKESEHTLRIPKGTYQIEKDLVIPSDRTLIIEKGVTLLLNPGVSVIIFGNIIAQGTKEKPITFQAHSNTDSWGTISIISENNKKNILDYLHIFNGGDAKIIISEKENDNLKHYVRGPISHINGKLTVTNTTFSKTKFTFVEDFYNNKISVIKHRNAKEEIIGLEFFPDNIFNIKIASIDIPSGNNLFYDQNKNFSIDTDDQKVFIQNGKITNSENKLISHSLYSFSDENDWDTQQKVPFGYLFLFESPVVETSYILEEVLGTPDNTPFTEVNRLPLETQEINVYTDTFAHINDINLSEKEFLKQHPLFYKEDEYLTLPSGEHTIAETIILPKNSIFKIQPGTTLKMKKNISILSYGQIIAKGTKENPIQILANHPDEPFGVVAVLGKTEKQSVFSYVKIQNGSDDSINGAFFSGMLSIYHTDALIQECQFENATGDDAINIKYSTHSIIEDSTFQNNSADAIDFDFMSGEIRNNTFIHNGNDSIDFSGSDTLVKDNVIQQSGDKCISTGERSSPTITNNILQECFIGVEVKDSSHPELSHNLFLMNKTAINSYNKKAFFEGGKGEFTENLFINNEKQITFRSAEGKKKRKGDNSVVKLVNNIFDTTPKILKDKTQRKKYCLKCSNNTTNKDLSYMLDEYLQNNSFDFFSFFQKRDSEQNK